MWESPVVSYLIKKVIVICKLKNPSNNRKITLTQTFIIKQKSTCKLAFPSSLRNSASCLVAGNMAGLFWVTWLDLPSCRISFNFSTLFLEKKHTNVNATHLYSILLYSRNSILQYLYWWVNLYLNTVLSVLNVFQHTIYMNDHITGNMVYILSS